MDAGRRRAGRRHPVLAVAALQRDAGRDPDREHASASWARPASCSGGCASTSSACRRRAASSSWRCAPAWSTPIARRRGSSSARLRRPVASRSPRTASRRSSASPRARAPRRTDERLARHLRPPAERARRDLRRLGRHRRGAAGLPARRPARAAARARRGTAAGAPGHPGAARRDRRSRRQPAGDVGPRQRARGHPLADRRSAGHRGAAVPRAERLRRRRPAGAGAPAALDRPRRALRVPAPQAEGPRGGGACARSTSRTCASSRCRSAPIPAASPRRT